MTASTATRPAGLPRLVPLNAEAVAAIMRDDRAAAGRLIGARVPEAWPDAELRSALPVHLERLRRSPADIAWGVRGILVDGELLGSAGFKGPPGRDGSVELGYGVVPEARGRGLASAAASALVEWAFRQPGVRRVRATIAPGNTASQVVARRAGLRHVGRAPDAQHGELEVWELGRLRYRIRRLRRSRTAGHSMATIE
jgi:ribosomal-protein-alanine N-acetyltransferase